MNEYKIEITTVDIEYKETKDIVHISNINEDKAIEKMYSIISEIRLNTSVKAIQFILYDSNDNIIKYEEVWNK